VRGFRNTHGITVYRDGEWAERGEIALPEAARATGFCLAPNSGLRADIPGPPLWAICRPTSS
jgi:hypothetical protein